MIPIRTAASNFVYRGPSPDIGDAWCERVPAEHGVYLEWQPSEEERASIAGGALIRLGIFGREPISPVSLNVSDHRVLSDAGAALRDQARDVLNREHGVLGPAGIPAGHWLVSSEIWEALQAEHALDPSDGVPTLWGRPLVELPGSDPATFEYAVAVPS